MIQLTTILICALGALVLAPSATAQILVNRGAGIHVRERAIMHVNGDVENRQGEIRMYDSSAVSISGSMSIVTGAVYMEKNSLATVTKDVFISVDGTCWRYDPGVMNVLGTIYNEGNLNNDGEINIGKP